MTSLLLTQNLGLLAGEDWRLRSVDLELIPGEIVAVCGPNGAGKSTLLSLLGGEMEPGEGQVYMQGIPLAAWERQELAKKRARLEQQIQMSFDFRVEEVVALGRFAWQESEQETREVVDLALQAAGASELAGRIITRLSGGERQRVHLARVLAQVWAVPGALLLLDEPISAQDLGHQQLIFRNLKARVREFQWSVVTVLHDLNLAGLYSDRVLLLEKGRMTRLGLPQDVLGLIDLARVYAADLEAYHHHAKTTQMVMIQP